MIRKLFGETEEQQFEYLKKRLIVLGIGVGLLAIGLLLGMIGLEFGSVIASPGTLMCIVVLFMFGWSIMRGLLGFASFGAILSGNVVIGVVIFVLFILVGYLGGIVVSIIGLCRFFVLLKKRKEHN